MSSYPNSIMHSFYFDHESEEWTCKVTIEDDRIEIGYDLEERGHVTWRGVSRGVGHYELGCPELEGRGTLHMFPDSKYLEGFWVESGIRGMWRIELR